MAFVKLDCGILDSTLWVERECREIFITGLLMARPREFSEPIAQIEVNSTNFTGWEAPPGWYGFIEAAGPGIIRRAGVELAAGLAALDRLGEPDPESRTPDFEGRRMIRVDGGYLILNFDRYRQKDHTAADRSRRYREKKTALRVSPDALRVASRSVTQAEAEADNTKVKDTVGQERPTPPPNGKHFRLEAQEILLFLNAKAGRGFPPLDVNLDLIAARLKEGATPAQCRQVIAKKAREWGGDEKMAEYLRPKTLFNRTNFAQYVGELVVST